MAIGIFLNGAALHFSVINSWGAVLSLILLAIWFSLALSFVKLAFKKKFISHHFKDPVQSFAVGTWVAGTSVCATVLAVQLPSWEWFAHSMGMFATILWLAFTRIWVRNFWRIYKFAQYEK